jgi:hypothetical protein
MLPVVLIVQPVLDHLHNCSLLLFAGATLRAERARATALSDERSRLEAALQAAADQAAAAEAQAAAARAEAEMSVQLAARAEQEALQAQQRLQEAEQEKQAVQAQLETVSEVVEQQQEELKVKEVQVGHLQQVVVDTREYIICMLVGLAALRMSALLSRESMLAHAVCDCLCQLLLDHSACCVIEQVLCLLYLGLCR